MKVWFLISFWFISIQSANAIIKECLKKVGYARKKDCLDANHKKFTLRECKALIHPSRRRALGKNNRNAAEIAAEYCIKEKYNLYTEDELIEFNSKFGYHRIGALIYNKGVEKVKLRAERYKKERKRQDYLTEKINNCFDKLNYNNFNLTKTSECLMKISFNSQVECKKAMWTHHHSHVSSNGPLYIDITLASFLFACTEKFKDAPPPITEFECSKLSREYIKSKIFCNELRSKIQNGFKISVKDFEYLSKNMEIESKKIDKHSKGIYTILMANLLNEFSNLGTSEKLTKDQLEKNYKTCFQKHIDEIYNQKKEIQKKHNENLKKRFNEINQNFKKGFDELKKTLLHALKQISAEFNNNPTYLLKNDYGEFTNKTKTYIINTLKDFGLSGIKVNKKNSFNISNYRISSNSEFDPSHDKFDLVFQLKNKTKNKSTVYRTTFSLNEILNTKDWDGLIDSKLSMNNKLKIVNYKDDVPLSWIEHANKKCIVEKLRLQNHNFTTGTRKPKENQTINIESKKSKKPTSNKK